jgi:hypothetical protein
VAKIPAHRTAHVECPECAEVIPVPLTITLRAEGTELVANVTSDTADLWAHAWTHTEADGA